MLGGIAKETGRAHVHVTTLPKPTEGGNPDFRLWNGKDRIVGYVEAKKPTEERLDLIEHSEQLKRYRSTFPNLILTNFLEFRCFYSLDEVSPQMSLVHMSSAVGFLRELEATLAPSKRSMRGKRECNGPYGGFPGLPHWGMMLINADSG